MFSVNAGPSLSLGLGASVAPDLESGTASSILRMSRQRKPQSVAVR